MLKSRVLTGAFVTAAFVVASVFAAAPASAATLPPGQKITVVDQDTWQFSTADPNTAALTPSTGVNDPGEDEQITAIDVDNKGLGFAFSTTYETIPGVPDPQNPNDPVFPTIEPAGAALFKADANTGLLSDGMKLSILWGDTEYNADECTALDYSGGQVIGVCYDWEFDMAFIGVVDTDGAVLNATSALFGLGFIYFTAIAKDAVTGVIWGFSDFKDNGYAWTITLDGVPPVSKGDLDVVVTGADFDSSGQLWVQAKMRPEAPALVIGPGTDGLATLDLTTFSLPFSAQWLDVEYVPGGITVWGEALPATGPTDSAPLWLGAAAFLLLGAILAVGASSRRRIIR